MQFVGSTSFVIIVIVVGLILLAVVIILMCLLLCYKKAMANQVEVINRIETPKGAAGPRSSPFDFDDMGAYDSEGYSARKSSAQLEIKRSHLGRPESTLSIGNHGIRQTDTSVSEKQSVHNQLSVSPAFERVLS